MSGINSKSTINRLLDDLETLAAWKEDLDARIRQAELCQKSSVGLSDERLDGLLHEGSAWRRAANGLVKRMCDMSHKKWEHLAESLKKNSSFWLHIRGERLKGGTVLLSNDDLVDNPEKSER